jgi:hypothetical protein
MEQKQVSERMYDGNADLGHEWECIEVLNTSEATWLVFIRDQEHSDIWKTVKVVADGKVTRKANYWLAWDGKKLAGTSDVKLMQSYRSELYGMVTSFFAGLR